MFCVAVFSFTNHLKPKLKLIAFDSAATFTRSLPLSLSVPFSFRVLSHFVAQPIHMWRDGCHVLAFM